MAAKAMTTISPTGNARRAADPAPTFQRSARLGHPSHAFTLIELILVMALLGLVLGAAAPALGRFFQGRTLDAEARRILVLTRYAQSRAAAEGVPMLLWIDPDQRTYGLRADSSYLADDPRAVEFSLAEGIAIEGMPASTSVETLLALRWRPSPLTPDRRPALRFKPDGYRDPLSLERILLREDNFEPLWIGPCQNHLYYEIQSDSSIEPRR
jgi:type II secretion system protein H